MQIILHGYFYEQVPRWYKQPHYVEIWTEKKAMINNLVPILRGKQITIVPIAGFSSTPFLYDNFVRLSKQADLGREVHVLYYGDFDPSGESISRDAKDRLQECMKRSNKHFDIDFQRIAVTREQITEYDLPQSLDDATYEKLEQDPRANKFVERHGELYQVELDALPALIPDEFREMIIESVDQFYDDEIRRETLREINKEYSTDKLNDIVTNLTAYWDEMYSPHDQDYYKDDDE